MLKRDTLKQIMIKNPISKKKETNLRETVINRNMECVAASNLSLFPELDNKSPKLKNKTTPKKAKKLKKGKLPKIEMSLDPSNSKHYDAQDKLHQSLKKMLSENYIGYPVIKLLQELKIPSSGSSKVSNATSSKVASRDSSPSNISWVDFIDDVSSSDDDDNNSTDSDVYDLEDLDSLIKSTVNAADETEVYLTSEILDVFKEEPTTPEKEWKPTLPNKKSGKYIRKQGDNYVIEILENCLNVFGVEALGFIDYKWEEVENVDTVCFQFIDFEKLVREFPKLKQKFPQITNFVFKETNMNHVGDVNALAIFPRVTSLNISTEGNGILKKPRWREYTIYRISNRGLQFLNEDQVSILFIKHGY